MKRKSGYLILGVIFFTVVMGLTTLANADDTGGSWVVSQGKKSYQSADGQLYRDCWLEINGNHYRMDSYGHVLTGWQKVGELWYYLDDTGVMQTGWIQDNGKWYYLGSIGYMRVGWVFVDSHWYYLNERGENVTANRYDGDLVYKFASSGELLSVSLEDKNGYQAFSTFILSSEEQNLIDIINEERVDYQGKPLILDLTLNKIAEERLNGALNQGYSERMKTVDGQGTLNQYLQTAGYKDKDSVEIYIADVEIGNDLEQFREEGEYYKLFNYSRVGISIQARSSRQYLMLVLAK